jgi:hypothetical protein
MLATVELDHGGARLDLEKKENFRRWNELCSELGGALGSQGGSEHRGRLNLMRGGSSTANFKEKGVGLLRPWSVKKTDVVHVGAQVEGRASPERPRRLATLAAKQLRALTLAGGASRTAAAVDRSPRCTPATVDIHILPILSFCKNQPKVELKPKVHQNKSCTKFCELQNIFNDQRQI